jgi:hypothetical protein
MGIRGGLIMAFPFVIKSSVNSLVLEMRAENADSILVKLSGFGIQAETSVYIYMSQGLGALFADLSNNWKGRQGVKEWGSLEGELTLKASCDHLGHIFLSVQLIKESPPIWDVHAELFLEAGQLEKMAKEARAFESLAFGSLPKA